MRGALGFVAAAALLPCLWTAPATAENRIVEHLSDGAQGGPPASIEGLAQPADGAVLFFRTAEPLSLSDTDASDDVYRRNSNGTLTLISDDGDGVGGTDEETGATLDFATSDGSVAIFSTNENLSPLDDNTLGSQDLYRREANGSLTYITDRPAADPDGNNDGGQFVGASPDASRVIFRTNAKFDPDLDGDSVQDIYAREPNGTFTALSEDDDVVGGNDTSGTDPAEVAMPVQPTSGTSGIGHRPPVSSDGTRVVFDSDDGIGTSDGDGNNDVFVNDSTQSPALQLFSDAPITSAVIFEGLAADTDILFFSTDVPVDATNDTDTSFDIYRRNVDDTHTLISDLFSSDPDDVRSPSLVGSSTDGSLAVFSTVEQYFLTDTDDGYDIYRRVANGQMERLTDDVLLGTQTDQNALPAARALTPDAGTLLFQTPEPLTTTDDDTADDVYASSSDRNPVHVSDATPTGDPNVNAVGQAVSTDASRLFFDTDEPLLGSDTDATSKDVYMLGPDGLQHLTDKPGTGTDAAQVALFEQINPLGTRMFFHTDESLTSSDQDGAQDVYVSRVFTPSAAGPGGNGAGTGSGAGQPAQSGDPTDPVLSRVTASATTFHLGSGLPALLSQRRPVGTIFSFTLSEPARVTFSFEQRARGRRVGRRCRRPTRRNRGRRRCTRYVRRGSFTVSAKAGRNRVRFRGRLSRRRRLRPGRYRMRVRATDAARNRSARRTLRLRVLRPRR